MMVPEYQANNKMVGKKVMTHAEKAGALATDQYGSRKHHKSIDCCMNKVITTDISRQRRAPTMIISNDARGCYDRINHVVAVLALMMFGVPWKVARTLFSVLKRSLHAIQTGLGTEEDMYGGLEDDIHGSGQGNGLAPALWALISTVLISLMHQKGHGISWKSALSGVVVSLICFSFVNDTDLAVTAQQEGDTGEDLIEPARIALDDWATFLGATGGELESSKTFCYMLDYELDTTTARHRYRTIEELPAEFTLVDNDGVRQPIARYEPSVGKKTLGVFLAMDGNSDAQYDYLMDTAKDFATQISGADVDHNTAQYTLLNSFMKTIEYCLPVTHLSLTQWNKIMSTALRAALPKCGYPRTLPLAKRFGPVKHGGIGIHHPFYWGAIIKLCSLLQELTCDSQTGALMKTSAENLRLETG